MSLVRAVCSIAQAVGHRLAFKPPNPTVEKDRYYTEQAKVLQIAPLIFWIHGAILTVCALFETYAYLSPSIPFLPSSLVVHSSIKPTSIFFVGVVLSIAGACLRLQCFRTLGSFFTFDLTIHEDHRLVTSDCYSWVRHPSYSGSIMIVIGDALSHLTRGSWLVETCFPCLMNTTHGGSTGCKVLRFALISSWWIWTFAVGVSRSRAEDEQLKKVFGSSWEQYARTVNWWFFPGII